jgi:5-methylcytosine-specific restriction endonuclease McrA
MHYTRVRRYGDPLFTKATATNPIEDGMKTCRKGLHKYPESERRCPECGKASQKRRIEKYAKTPKGKAARRRNERKWRKSKRGKEWMKSYRDDPQNKERAKLLKQTPQSKAKLVIKNSKRYNLSIEGDLTDQDILDRYDEFEGLCAYCSVKLLTKNNGVERYHPQYQTIDHIIPITKNGKNTKSNIVPACRACNRSKDNKNILDWLDEMGITPSDRLKEILKSNK